MGLIADIWASLRRLPAWVQIWVVVILVPVNMAALAFVGQPIGVWIAILAVGGMTPNLFLLIHERGFSRAMSLSHLVLWTPLVVLILATLTGPSDLAPQFQSYLVALIIVDVISLAFDVIDGWRWWQGERDIA